MGIKAASGEIIVLQNPEVMHVGDCLHFVSEHLKEKDWISFNCFGSPDFDFNNELVNKTEYEIFKKIDNMQMIIGGNSVARDKVGGWLNHYDFHFVGYHYLAAIHKSDITNYIHPGFNENFKNGVSAEDDEFIKRLIYNNFCFKICEFKSGNPFCVHLYHEKPKCLSSKDRIEVNKKHFVESCKRMKMVPQNDIHLAPFEETPKAKRVLL